MLFSARFARITSGVILGSLILLLSGCLYPKKINLQSAYSKDEKIISRGQQLFQLNCSACHNFLQQGIGPSLEQVTTLASSEWVKSFIRNAPSLIEKGDARASQLYKQYNQMMPSFEHLKTVDIAAIAAYINTEQKSSTAESVDTKGALENPIFEKIAPSGLFLQLEDFSKAPPTADKTPVARINQMRVLPGAKDLLFIHDLQGFLYEVQENNWRLALDIRKERPLFINEPGMGTGLGSFAFHPEFYQNGLLYTTHTEPSKTAIADFAYEDSIKVSMQWVLTEWKIKDPTTLPFSGTSRTLLRINVVTGIHGVQEIAFNPLAKKNDPTYGLLYIGIGDGGASENGYPFICDSKRRIWSSVLCIDPSGRNSKNGQYGIPAGNPYAKLNDDQACREVYCRGFRNPNRFSWAPDGRMLVADIGHFNCEELNIAQTGGDYGWPYREGTFVINPRGKMSKVYPLPADDAKAGYLYPVLQYDHDEGKAIEGGFVYQGTAVPMLKGKYIFGDINNGRIFFADWAQLQQGKQVKIQEFGLKMGSEVVTLLGLSKGIKPDTRLGEGIDHELFIFTKSDGQVYKIVHCTQ